MCIWRFADDRAGRDCRNQRLVNVTYDDLFEDEITGAAECQKWRDTAIHGPEPRIYSFDMFQDDSMAPRCRRRKAGKRAQRVLSGAGVPAVYIRKRRAG